MSTNGRLFRRRAENARQVLDNPWTVFRVDARPVADHFVDRIGPGLPACTGRRDDHFQIVTSSAFVRDKFAIGAGRQFNAIVAAAIVEGAAGERQFSDHSVRDPVIMALRDRVSTVVDPQIKEDQVRITITLKDGRESRVTMHLIEGSKEQIEQTLQQSVEAFFDLYPEI